MRFALWKCFLSPIKSLSQTSSNALLFISLLEKKCIFMKLREIEEVSWAFQNSFVQATHCFEVRDTFQLDKIVLSPAREMV